MADLFGLHPWDIRRLTYGQLLRFVAYTDAWIKANSKGA